YVSLTLSSALQSTYSPFEIYTASGLVSPFSLSFIGKDIDSSRVYYRFMVSRIRSETEGSGLMIGGATMIISYDSDGIGAITYALNVAIENVALEGESISNVSCSNLSKVRTFDLFEQDSGYSEIVSHSLCVASIEGTCNADGDDIMLKYAGISINLERDSPMNTAATINFTGIEAGDKCHESQTFSVIGSIYGFHTDSTVVDPIAVFVPVFSKVSNESGVMVLDFEYSTWDDLSPSTQNTSEALSTDISAGFHSQHDLYTLNPPSFSIVPSSTTSASANEYAFMHLYTLCWIDELEGIVCSQDDVCKTDCGFESSTGDFENLTTDIFSNHIPFSYFPEELIEDINHSNSPSQRTFSVNLEQRGKGLDVAGSAFYTWGSNNSILNPFSRDVSIFGCNEDFIEVSGSNRVKVVLGSCVSREERLRNELIPSDMLSFSTSDLDQFSVVQILGRGGVVVVENFYSQPVILSVKWDDDESLEISEVTGSDSPQWIVSGMNSSKSTLIKVIGGDYIPQLSSSPSSSYSLTFPSYSVEEYCVSESPENNIFTRNIRTSCQNISENQLVITINNDTFDIGFPSACDDADTSILSSFDRVVDTDVPKIEYTLIGTESALNYCLSQSWMMISDSSDIAELVSSQLEGLISFSMNALDVDVAPSTAFLSFPFSSCFYSSFEPISPTTYQSEELVIPSPISPRSHTLEFCPIEHLCSSDCLSESAFGEVSGHGGNSNVSLCFSQCINDTESKNDGDSSSLSACTKACLDECEEACMTLKKGFIYSVSSYDSDVWDHVYFDSETITLVQLSFDSADDITYLPESSSISFDMLSYSGEYTSHEFTVKLTPLLLPTLSQMPSVDPESFVFARLLYVPPERLQCYPLSFFFSHEDQSYLNESEEFPLPFQCFFSSSNVDKSTAGSLLELNSSLHIWCGGIVLDSVETSVSADGSEAPIPDFGYPSILSQTDIQEIQNPENICILASPNSSNVDKSTAGSLLELNSSLHIWCGGIVLDSVETSVSADGSEAPIPDFGYPSILSQTDIQEIQNPENICILASPKSTSQKKKVIDDICGEIGTLTMQTVDALGSQSPTLNVPFALVRPRGDDNRNGCYINGISISSSVVDKSTTIGELPSLDVDLSLLHDNFLSSTTFASQGSNPHFHFRSVEFSSISISTSSLLCIFFLIFIVCGTIIVFVFYLLPRHIKESLHEKVCIGCCGCVWDDYSEKTHQLKLEIFRKEKEARIKARKRRRDRRRKKREARKAGGDAWQRWQNAEVKRKRLEKTKKRLEKERKVALRAQSKSLLRCPFQVCSSVNSSSESSLSLSGNDLDNPAKQQQSSDMHMESILSSVTISSSMTSMVIDPVDEVSVDSLDSVRLERKRSLKQEEMERRKKEKTREEEREIAKKKAAVGRRRDGSTVFASSGLVHVSDAPTTTKRVVVKRKIRRLKTKVTKSPKVPGNDNEKVS
ncbi:hypothetical protein ADUPG1_009298, partial [Aduncisulcus paluster]